MQYLENAAPVRLSTMKYLALVGLVMLTMALAPINSFAQSDTTSYSPTAYGTYAFVGNTVLVGQTALPRWSGSAGPGNSP
jgi:hypothetical protein